MIVARDRRLAIVCAWAAVVLCLFTELSTRTNFRSSSLPLAIFYSGLAALALNLAFSGTLLIVRGALIYLVPVAASLLAIARIVALVT
jgi:hypothetical protein